jgi:pilus assembly protein FimV
MLFLLLQNLVNYKGGTVHSSKLKQITVAICMALVPISVFAAGLGKLNVMSGLGEPLKADIELISVTPEELSTITAAIASEDAYATQGIEKPASHNTIKVNVAKNANGAPILKLQSSQPISEPFLDMLIQVDWASGRLLREYTVLLDPPGYTGEVDTSTSSVQAPMVKSGDSRPSSAVQNDTTRGDAMARPPTSKKSKPSKAKPAETAPNEELMPAGDASGADHLTQRGDTLAKIARDMKPEGISLEQMLVGLYQANPDAFQGNNMNRLKVGQIIRSPSEEALSAITRKKASQEIKVQTANWNAYRNKLAGIVADSAPVDSEANTQSAGGKIKSADDKSAPATTGSKDVVKLSAGDATASKASAENVKSLQDKITALQEEATAREKSVKEAQDRTASLEKQIADMQKLLAMKNGAMSDLQKQAEAQTAADKAKAAQVKPVEAAPAAVEPVKTEAEKPVVVEKPAEEVKPLENAPVATEPVKPEPAATPAAEKPAKKPIKKPAAQPEPAPEQSFLDGILGGLGLPPLLLPAGGVLALLGGGWMYLRKKREKSLADFEQGIMTSGGLKANTVFGNTASASVDTGDTSFLTDFSQSSNGGMIDTNDVDPIAEAEVYMAYGRDAQAEEILKDAITKEPKRYELHLKLLEMYAASKNVSAFETISGELYTTLGAEDPTWAKVAEIGIKLEPNNPLYQANSHPTGGGSAAAVAAVSAVGAANVSKADAGEKLEANDFSDSPLAAEKDLDFSFDNDALTRGFAPTGAVKTDELNMDSAVSETKPELFAATDLADAKDSNTMDFDMGDFNMGDFGSAAPAEEPIKTAVEEFGHTMPSLDVPTFAAPQFMPEVADELPMLGEMAAETFEFPQVEETPAEGVLDISGMAAEASGADDFNFDIPTIAPESLNAAGENLAEASTYDLSEISFDLNDTPASNSAELSIEEPSTASASEPIEVETKLELVTAYIEMDDKEGAKELLAEVMKEGGINQRKRAEELLAKLA